MTLSCCVAVDVAECVDGGLMRNDDHIIGIGDVAASARPEAVLKTFGLGSCVAVILYDPLRMAGGMAHIALPEAAAVHTSSRTQPVAPAYYADKGMELLLRHMDRIRRGAGTGGLQARLVGGASMMPNSRYLIGRRNVDVLHQLLSRHAIPLVAEDVGGELSRTVFFEIANGRVTVASPGRKHIVL